MKKTVFFFTFLLLVGSTAFAQITYQFAFTFPNAAASISGKTFFLNYGDGSGLARLRFNAPGTNDSVLIDMKAAEENTDKIAGCSGADRLYFKLQKNQVIYGSDNNIVLPSYFCFKKNNQTGFYEPFGFSYAIDDCKAPVTAFTEIKYLEKKDLTNAFVLNYFTPRDKFYTGLFASTRSLTVSELSVKMHLLIVANTFDEHIGKACAKDMKRAIKFFRDIKDFLGIQFEYDTISGKKYNLSEVEKAIEKLRSAAPNDIIVFYYSGHGFRQNGDNRRPPYIDLRPNYDENPNNLNSKSLADIFQVISDMPARFKLILSDCCNDLSKTYSVKTKAPSITKGFSLTGNIQNGAELFLNAARTSILATGANPGQRSICNDDFGGFFSYNFLNSIENQLSFATTGPSWDKIIEEARVKTRNMSLRADCPLPNNPSNSCNQIPYFEKQSR
ncbi:MAG: caspase family protein [Ferruginibacter sp.]